MRLCRRQYFCGRTCIVYLLARIKYTRSFFSDDTLKCTTYRRVTSLILTEPCQVFPTAHNSRMWVLPLGLFSSYCCISAAMPRLSPWPILAAACCPFGEPLPTTPCIWSLRSRETVQMVSSCPQILLFLAHATSWFSLCDREDLAKSLPLASTLLNLREAVTSNGKHKNAVI